MFFRNAAAGATYHGLMIIFSDYIDNNMQLCDNIARRPDHEPHSAAAVSSGFSLGGSMKKLSLNPDSVRVQSFTTSAEVAVEGTVNGYEAPPSKYIISPSYCGTCTCPDTVVAM